MVGDMTIGNMIKKVTEGNAIKDLNTKKLRLDENVVCDRMENDKNRAL